MLTEFSTGPLESFVLEDRFRELMARTIGFWNICPFWTFRGKMFSLSEKALLIALFDVWHTSGRPSWFYSTNANLEQLAGVAHRSFQVARNSLIKKCVIKFKTGKRGRPRAGSHQTASSYSISQDFLNTLTINTNKTSPLNTSTSTYSVGAEVAVFPDSRARKNGY